MPARARRPMHSAGRRNSVPPGVVCACTLLLGCDLRCSSTSQTSLMRMVSMVCYSYRATGAAFAKIATLLGHTHHNSRRASVRCPPLSPEAELACFVRAAAPAGPAADVATACGPLGPLSALSRLTAGPCARAGARLRGLLRRRAARRKRLGSGCREGCGLARGDEHGPQ